MKINQQVIGIVVVSALLTTSSLSFQGCGGDDDSVTPPEPSTGTISVNPDPDSLNAPWSLSGPDGYLTTGTGDMVLDELSEGTYTLTWGVVDGWIEPNPGVLSQVLAAGGTLTFSGTYVGIPGPVGDFVTIPAGTFQMGSPTGEADRDSDETQHTVTLTTPFLMQTTEVTNAQYAEVAQWALANGHCTSTTTSLRDALDGSYQELLDLDDSDCEISYSGGVFTVDAGKADHPVLEVTWYGAAAYCDWLSLREGLARAYDHGTWRCNGHDPYNAVGYRLPTEAEWEYACRSETTTPFHTGPCLDAGTEANYNGNYPYSDCPAGSYEGWTVPVGSYPANDWNLHDMHGNLYEWCNDWYDSYGGDATDPAGPSGPGAARVIRGGSWAYYAEGCRSAYRNYTVPYVSFSSIGFRPVRSTN